MNKSKVGPVVAALMAAGVGLILFVNREPGKASPRDAGPSTGLTVQGAPREHPIGDDQIKNHMTVAAVWLESVGMAGMPEPSTDVIHIEADIHSTVDNPNGFAKAEFIPYLVIKYELSDAKGGRPLDSGSLLPMIAGDGLHYGANISKPGAGSYRLTYKIEPPSAGGLGRHLDVAAWWSPFEVSFDWTMDSPERQDLAATPAAK